MGSLVTTTLEEMTEAVLEMLRRCVLEAGLASMVVDSTWGRSTRMSEGDSMPSRVRDPSRREDPESIRTLGCGHLVFLSSQQRIM